MPSPNHAADLERVLTRAAEECASGRAWFGEGLPQALRSRLEAAGRSLDSAAADLAFVDLSPASKPEAPPAGSARVVALSIHGVADLPSLTRAAESADFAISRLLCPFAVFDFTANGLQVREIRHGLTAADIQQELNTPLWAGPDLKELGSH